MPAPTIIRWFFYTAAVVIVSLLLLAALLALPLSDFTSRLQQNGVVQIAFAHTRAAAALVGLLAAFIAGWLVWRRRFRALAACAFVGMLAVLAAGVQAFQRAHPYADFFSTQRYRDAAAVLLGTDTVLSEFDPEPSLVVQRESVERAAYPAIDVHFHMESLPSSMTPERLVAAMDAVGVAKIVNLGGVPGMFERYAETFYAKYPDRFILFAKPDPSALERPNGVAEQLEWIKTAARMGARGLKESKSFGLGQLDGDGKLVPVDDLRLAPLWDLAGQLGMPLLIHTGEPTAFWEPVDEHNERYAELLANPGASLRGANMPTFQELMAERERLLARHPGTNFIGAHMGMNANDLEYVGSLLDKYPNYYVDMSSVVGELGRQPRTAREFFIRYQDRILFGTDGGFDLQPDGNGWTPERYYRSYFEFLETANEFIRYPFWDVAKQGNWRVYGIDLPDEVLRKIYVTNAERLIPTEANVRERLQALEAGAGSAAPSTSP
jgi:predicted TIM-barrel fold metal-dependent hydrolase